MAPSLIALAFSAALAGSAALIFWIEPLFAKLILPVLGGTPAVWTTALMFYQAVLFAGYLYAHLLMRMASARRQAALHLAVLAAAATTLPPVLPALPLVDPNRSPLPYALWALTAGVGLPLFALSASAPLLQRWFAQSGHRHAADPYFLYAASNAGSLAALVAFPLVLEPSLRLGTQAAAWSIGYGLIGLLVVLCAVATKAPAPSAAASATAEPAGVRWRWLALAAAPSSLLSGVTTAITTDVASAPLFWTVPLALYLLTFILAFARRTLLPVRLAMRLLPLPLAGVVLGWFSLPILGALPLALCHLATFFLAAYVCHAELARSRPAAGRLTEFYLVLSAGGLLGGTFNALVAPTVFTGVLEYPLALMLAVALRPALLPGGPRARLLDVLLPAALAAGAVAIATLPGETTIGVMLAAALLSATGLALLAMRPLRLALGIGAVYLAAVLAVADDEVLAQDRNFFGVLKVLRDTDQGLTLLVHGTTLHGAQATAPERRRQPLSYYHPLGPLGDVFRTMEDRLEGGAVAAIGLGAGSVACYARPGQHWTFYEIDPAVVRVARDAALFTFLADCTPDAAMVVGDARLRLAEAADDAFRLIVLDAFSSDSIPVHLLTRQALGLYLDKLAAGGVIALHITNRHLDLRPVVAALAAERGLAALARYDRTPASGGKPSLWAVLAKDASGLGALAADPAWQPLPPPATRPWSDDFSDILTPLLARKLRETHPQP